MKVVPRAPYTPVGSITWTPSTWLWIPKHLSAPSASHRGLCPLAASTALRILGQVDPGVGVGGVEPPRLLLLLLLGVLAQGGGPSRLLLKHEGCHGGRDQHIALGLALLLHEGVAVRVARAVSLEEHRVGSQAHRDKPRGWSVFWGGLGGFWPHQVVQHPHEGLELVLAQAALVQGPKGGASTAHGTQAVGHTLLCPLQHYQVLRAARARQC
ncbi:hypothetical protein Nmel_018532 [Mimus melanotis]